MTYVRLLSIPLLLFVVICVLRSEVAFGTEELPPPWNGVMPPHELDVLPITKEGRSEQRFENLKLPMSYRVSSPFRGKLEHLQYFVHIKSDIVPLKVPGAPSCRWSVGMASVLDGGLFPLCGQIYCWNPDEEIRKKGVFRLIPEHELSIAPKDAMRVLHLPFDGRLQVYDDSGRLANVVLTVGLNREDDWIDDSRIRLRVPVHVQCIPRSDRRDLPVKMSELELSKGDSFDAQVWRFKVERIVFPQPKGKNIGWIDLRIMKSEAKEN